MEESNRICPIFLPLNISKDYQKEKGSERKDDPRRDNQMVNINREIGKTDRTKQDEEAQKGQAEDDVTIGYLLIYIARKFKNYLLKCECVQNDPEFSSKLSLLTDFATIVDISSMYLPLYKQDKEKAYEQFGIQIGKSKHEFKPSEWKNVRLYLDTILKFVECEVLKPKEAIEIKEPVTKKQKTE